MAINQLETSSHQDVVTSLSVQTGARKLMRQVKPEGHEPCSRNRLLTPAARVSGCRGNNQRPICDYLGVRTEFTAQFGFRFRTRKTHPL